MATILILALLLALLLFAFNRFGGMPMLAGFGVAIAGDDSWGDENDFHQMADVASRGVPLPQDAELVLQASVTKTADFNGAGLYLGAGFAPGGVGVPMAAVISVTAGDRANSDETYAFRLEESSDDSTYVACGAYVNVTVATTVFTTGTYVAKGVITKPYVRLALDVAGTTPSITYSAKLNPNV